MKTPGPFIKWGRDSIDLSTVKFSQDWGIVTERGGFLAWTHSQIRRFCERADAALAQAGLAVVRFDAEGSR